MRRTAATALVGLMMIGCGSSSSTTRGRTLTDNEAGMAGSLVEPPETGGSTQTGGTTGETGGTGGTVEPSGGTDSGGTGTGGDDPISTGGTETGGEPGAGGNVGICTPKTCLTYAVEMTGSNELQACGLIEDGCGNYIDCGGCEDDSQICGGGSANRNAPYGIADDGIEGICNGGCLMYSASDPASEQCSQFPDHPNTVICPHGTVDYTVRYPDCIQSSELLGVCC